MVPVDSPRQRKNLSLAEASRYLLLISIFFLPFELPITQASHGFLRDYIGWLFLLVHPFSAAVFLSLIVRKESVATPRLLFGCVLVMALAIGASTIIQSGDPERALRYVYFGCGSILLGHFIGRQQDNAFLQALFYGALAWSLMVLVSYAIYYSDAQIGGFHEMSIGEQIVRLRSPGARIANNSIFFLLAGNVNKVANYAVLFMLVGALAYLRGSVSFRLHLIYQALLVAILTICFSRGAFMVCALIGVGFAVAAYRWQRQEQRPRALPWIALLLALPPAISVAHPDFRSRWTDMENVQYRLNQMSGLSDTTGSATPKEPGEITSAKPSQTPTASKPSPAPTASKPSPAPTARGSDWRLLPFGYGIGNYGQQHYGDPGRRTHNLIIDLWTDGGLVAPGMLLLLMGAPAFVAVRTLLRRWSLDAFIGLAGLLTILALAFREYELGYLNATAMGGFLLGLFAGLIDLSDKKENLSP